MLAEVEPSEVSAMSTVERLIKQARTVRDANAAALLSVCLTRLAEHSTTLYGLAVESDDPVVESDPAYCYDDVAGSVKWIMHYRGKFLSSIRIRRTSDGVFYLALGWKTHIGEYVVEPRNGGPSDEDIGIAFGRLADTIDATFEKTT
jgi:hypothetical protein